MGQTSAKLCDQCLYCLVFLRLSRKKSLQYLELEDFGVTAKEENKEICEEPKLQEIKPTLVGSSELLGYYQEPKLQEVKPTALVDSSEFLSYYQEPAEYKCEKMLDKDGILVFGQTFEDGFLIKAYWGSKFSPSQLYSYFRNLEQRKLWDKNIEVIEELPIDGSDEYFTYMKFKKVVAISQRDSVIISQKLEKSDGIVLVSKSCTHDRYQETEGVMRMKIFVAGYYFKAVDEGNIRTRIFTCTKANFGGSISHKFILKATAMALPPMYKAMEKCMENYYRTNS